MKNFLKSAFSKHAAFMGGAVLMAAVAGGALNAEAAAPCVKMTRGEAALAHGIFGAQINTGIICKHFESEYKEKMAAAVPDDRNIYFYGPDYHEKDFSRTTRTYNKGNIAHEETHIWQRQTKLQYTNGRCDLYNYSPFNKKDFKDFCSEQQAAIIEDYTLRFYEGVPSRWLAGLFGADTPESDRLLKAMVENMFPETAKTRLAIEAKRAISAHKGQPLPAR